jgi:hypothetical protein
MQVREGGIGTSPYLSRQENEELKEETGRIIWDSIMTKLLVACFKARNGAIEEGLLWYQNPDRCQRCLNQQIELQVFYEMGSRPTLKAVRCSECHWEFSFSFMERS